MTRVKSGGHDVPKEKLFARYPRTVENLRRAISELPHVLVFDHSDPAGRSERSPSSTRAKTVELNEPVPRWLPWS